MNRPLPEGILDRLVEHEAMWLRHHDLENEEHRLRIGPRMYLPWSYWISLAQALRWMKQKGIVPIMERSK